LNVTGFDETLFGWFSPGAHCTSSPSQLNPGWGFGFAESPATWIAGIATLSPDRWHDARWKSHSTPEKIPAFAGPLLRGRWRAQMAIAGKPAYVARLYIATDGRDAESGLYRPLRRGRRLRGGGRERGRRIVWQQLIDRHGLAGLRTTRIQQYRQRDRVAARLRDEPGWDRVEASESAVSVWPASGPDQSQEPRQPGDGADA